MPVRRMWLLLALAGAIMVASLTTGCGGGGNDNLVGGRVVINQRVIEEAAAARATDVLVSLIIDRQIFRVRHAGGDTTLPRQFQVGENYQVIGVVAAILPDGTGRPLQYVDQWITAETTGLNVVIE